MAMVRASRRRVLQDLKDEGERIFQQKNFERRESLAVDYVDWLKAIFDAVHTGAIGWRGTKELAEIVHDIGW